MQIMSDLVLDVAVGHGHSRRSTGTQLRDWNGLLTWVLAQNYGRYVNIGMKS